MKDINEIKQDAYNAGEELTDRMIEDGISKNQLANLEQARSNALVAQNVTPMQVIQQAVQNGASIETLTGMMQLQERWEANEARKAFSVAMGNFKAAGITVAKNKQVGFGTTKYKHATLENVCETIGEELTKHGLSFRWQVDQDDAKIKISCILSHVFGHSEKTSFVCPADTTGSKNAIQAIGSAITYGQRYTLLAITGTATGEDTDGKDIFDETALAAHVEALRACKAKGELLTAWLAASSAAAGDKKAYRALEAVRDEQSALIAKGAGGAAKGGPANPTAAPANAAPAPVSQAAMEEFNRELK